MFNNYCGLYYIKIFNKVYHAVRASRILTPYFLLYGILTIFLEGQNSNLSILDVLFILFLIPQLIASFTPLVLKQYMKLFNELHIS